MRRELALTPSARADPPGRRASASARSCARPRRSRRHCVLVSLYARLHVVFVNAAEDARGVAEYLLAFQFVEQLFVVGGILAGALLPLAGGARRDAST